MDFTARGGQLIAVTGTSGCGKTTLLRACAGALPPGFTHAGGGIEVLGTAVLGLAARPLRQVRHTAIRYVGQDPSSRLNPRMRVGQLVRETAHDRSDTAVHDLLTRLHLGPADLLMS